MSDEAPPDRAPWHVLLIASVAVGAVGLISGIEGTTATPRSELAPRHEARTTDSRSYRDMLVNDYGPNRDLPKAWFDAIRRPPDLLAPVVQTDVQREGALARRATRRAYDGAPPTIPHPVPQHGGDEQGAPPCLACHEAGARVGNLVAPVMSHARRDSCLQCHVADRDPRPPGATPPAPETTFAGLHPSRGERAWAGAPPTIPHSTAMRDRCESCHGVYGSLGMRTTHPWRASCQQCHPPSAALDRRPPVKGGL